MNRKRNHKTTKNTIHTKNPVTRLMVIGVECNGTFELVTDFKSQQEFDKIFMEWYHNPNTTMWCDISLISYIKMKQPNRICLLKEDYEKLTNRKGVIPATKEEYESENN